MYKMNDNTVILVLKVKVVLDSMEDLSRMHSLLIALKKRECGKHYSEINIFFIF